MATKKASSPRTSAKRSSKTIVEQAESLVNDVIETIKGGIDAGLSTARRAGIKVPAPAGAKPAARRKAAADNKVGAGRRAAAKAKTRATVTKASTRAKTAATKAKTAVKKAATSTKRSVAARKGAAKRKS